MAIGEIKEVISFETGGLEMAPTHVGSASHSIETTPGPTSSKETYYAEVRNGTAGGYIQIRGFEQILEEWTHVDLTDLSEEDQKKGRWWNTSLIDYGEIKPDRETI